MVSRAHLKTSDFDSGTAIEPSDSPSTIYGYRSGSSNYEFFTMQIDPSGIKITNSATGLIAGAGDIKCESGKIYSTTGVILDPVHRTVIGRYQLPTLLPGATIVSVLPDSSRALTFFLSVNNSTADLLAFDERTLRKSER
jgi:hypothetical protein